MTAEWRFYRMGYKGGDFFYNSSFFRGEPEWHEIVRDGNFEKKTKDILIAKLYFGARTVSTRGRIEEL